MWVQGLKPVFSQLQLLDIQFLSQLSGPCGLNVIEAPMLLHQTHGFILVVQGQHRSCTRYLSHHPIRETQSTEILAEQDEDNTPEYAPYYSSMHHKQSSFHHQGGSTRTK